MISVYKLFENTTTKKPNKKKDELINKIRPISINTRTGINNANALALTKYYDNLLAMRQAQPSQFN